MTRSTSSIPFLPFDSARCYIHNRSVSPTCSIDRRSSIHRESDPGQTVKLKAHSHINMTIDIHIRIHNICMYINKYIHIYICKYIIIHFIYLFIHPSTDMQRALRKSAQLIQYRDHVSPQVLKHDSTKIQPANYALSSKLNQTLYRHV